jgi:hypothetical protein
LADVESEKTSADEVINLTFSPVGQSRVSECVRTHTGNGLGLTACTIVVKYNFLNSYLVVDTPEDMDVQILQKVVDQVLIGTDSRISEVDK